MRIVTTGEGVHEVRFRSWKGTLFMGIWFVFFACTLVSNMRDPSGTHHRIVGPLIGVGLTGLTAALFYETGRFVFDTRRRSVTWHWKSLYSQRSGEIAFAEIRDIILESRRSGRHSRNSGRRGSAPQQECKKGV